MNLVDEEKFKTTQNGKTISLYTLKNASGMAVQITNLGAIIVSIFVPDKKGKPDDVVQGYDTGEEYLTRNQYYYGAICGRCANRIHEGKFVLDGKEHQLVKNAGTAHLHGGLIGFDKKVWKTISASSNQLVLELFSEDGEESYPGNLKVTATYALNEQNELRLDYSAVADKATLINLAAHSYFNLAGAGSGDIYKQKLQINAHFTTPMSPNCVPTGEIISVKKSPFDFTKLTPFGKGIKAAHKQIKLGRGFDHNFVLNHRLGTLEKAAMAHDAKTGRLLEVSTTLPGIQLYTANWVKDEIGKAGKTYKKQWSFCLETQYFPDAVNHSHFPSNIFTPEHPYQHSTVYKFSIK